jgi:hypothetical protein
VVGPSGLQVDEPSGERWELALDLLREGRESVRIGVLRLARQTSGPAPDGRIHVSIDATNGPEFTTRDGATAEIERGRSQLDALLTADNRLANLVALHGIAGCDYIYDYGMGSVVIATVDNHGAVTWDKWSGPRS